MHDHNYPVPLATGQKPAMDLRARFTLELDHLSLKIWWKAANVPTKRRDQERARNPCYDDKNDRDQGSRYGESFHFHFMN